MATQTMTMTQTRLHRITSIFKNPITVAKNLPGTTFKAFLTTLARSSGNYYETLFIFRNISILFFMQKNAIHVLPRIREKFIQIIHKNKSLASSSEIHPQRCMFGSFIQKKSEDLLLIFISVIKMSFSMLAFS